MKTEYIKQYQKEGWITRQDAMAILDRKDSGRLDEELKKAGIHYITMPWENSDNGSGKNMYRGDQVQGYAKQCSLFKSGPVAGDNNGGRMASRINALENSQNSIANALGNLAIVVDKIADKVGIK